MFTVTSKAQVIDSILSAYVSAFEQEAKNRGFNTFPHLQCVKFPTHTEDSVFEISKQRPGKGWDGVVIFYESGEILVFINRESFEKSCEVGKEMIVYHELLHAYFMYPHIPGCTLMKEGVITGDAAAYYRDNKNLVLDQVFKRIRK